MTSPRSEVCYVTPAHSEKDNIESYDDDYDGGVGDAVEDDDNYADNCDDIMVTMKKVEIMMEMIVKMMTATMIIFRKFIHFGMVTLSFISHT